MKYQKMFTLLTAMGANVTQTEDPDASPPCDLKCAEIVQHHAQEMCMVKWLFIGGLLIPDLREGVIILTAIKTYLRPRMARCPTMNDECFWQCSLDAPGVCPEGASTFVKGIL